MDILEWREQQSSIRKYAHFDKRTSLKKSWNYITNPSKVAKHSFYPFIHYTLTFKKYNGTSVKLKERELCYSAHLDRCIYQYYGFLLNQKYNQYSERHGFSSSAIAYRNNMQGRNNIHFANHAFDFIKQCACYIIVGDFTHFFDELDHRYLKQKICTVLEKQPLSPDFYAVFKNITRFSKWDLKDILEIGGLSESNEDIIKLNNQTTALSKEQFLNNSKRYIKPNTNNYGIPQGSAISAVLSNVYMIDFDRLINEFVNQRGGLYLRYSDDFMIVLPFGNDNVFTECFENIRTIIDSIPRVILQPDKTQIYQYYDNVIRCRSNDFIDGSKADSNMLNYLGFSFDGNRITIRDKTISKYYYRLYRKIRTIVKTEGVTSKGNKISYHNLYIKYSKKGAAVGKGNFLSYVKRAEEVFGDKSDVGRVSKVHFQKIRKKLKEGGL